MDAELTFPQMFEDLVAAATQTEPPAESFSITKFAESAEIDRQKAQRILDKRVRAGELERGKFVVDGHCSWYYWFVKVEE